MALALRFNWTEAQVDATDPDLVAELLTFVKAENDHAKFVDQQNRNKGRK